MEERRERVFPIQSDAGTCIFSIIFLTMNMHYDYMAEAEFSMLAHSYVLSSLLNTFHPVSLKSRVLQPGYKIGSYSTSVQAEITA